MKQSLSFDEQNEIIEKLRSEIKENAKEFGKKVYDLSAFEDRLNFSIKNRIDLGGFLLAEISHLDKLKNKIDEKKKARENSISKTIDDIIKQQVKKIAHYPELDIHPKASSELKKLLWGFKSFFSKEFHWMESIIRLENDISLSKDLHYFREKINYFVGNAKRGVSPRIEDHLLILKRPFLDYSAIELDDKRFIKDIALFLNEFKDFLVNIIYEKKLRNILLVIKITKLEKGLSDLNIEEIIKKIIKNINIILADFRIQDFKLA